MSVARPLTYHELVAGNGDIGIVKTWRGVDPAPPAVGSIPERRTSWTADELLAETFPEPRWAVPDILAEGLNLLAGAPKLGKSWFGLNLAVAVAAGGKAIGRVDVEAGDALYGAFEDPARRMQDRLRKVLADSPPSPRLTIWTECPPIPAGGAEQLGGWLEAHPAARLVVVDVFARVRGKSDPRTDRYEADYHAAGALKDLADKYGVAILLVHHTRKQVGEDWLDSVSGTQGLAGAADAVLVLTRARNTKQAVLKVTGRDIAEAEYAVELDASLGLWTMLDAPAADLELTDERRRIVAAVRETEGLGPKQIADATGLSHDVVKQLVRRMVEASQLDTDGAGHYLPPFTPFTPFTEGSDQ